MFYLKEEYLCQALFMVIAAYFYQLEQVKDYIPDETENFAYAFLEILTTSLSKSEPMLSWSDYW